MAVDNDVLDALGVVFPAVDRSPGEGLRRIHPVPVIPDAVAVIGAERRGLQHTRRCDKTKQNCY